MTKIIHAFKTFSPDIFIEFGLWRNKAGDLQLLVCLGALLHFGYCKDTGGWWKYTFRH
jgi:hypothetical protein